MLTISSLSEHFFHFFKVSLCRSLGLSVGIIINARPMYRTISKTNTNNKNNRQYRATSSPHIMETLLSPNAKNRIYFSWQIANWTTQPNTNLFIHIARYSMAPEKMQKFYDVNSELTNVIYFWFVGKCN